MHILDFVIPPDSIMHPLPAESLQSIINIRKTNPSTSEHIAEELLVRKTVVGSRIGCELMKDLVVDALRWVDY